MDTNKPFQYLQQLDTRRAAGKDSFRGDGDEAFLCFGIQGKRFYIRTEHIGEILSYTKPSTVGHTAPWFEGITKVHGEIYSVLNISPFVGEGLNSNKNRYTIALAPQYNNTAIVADEIYGLQALVLAGEVVIEKYTDTCQVEEKEICILSVERLLSSPELANISIF